MKCPAEKFIYMYFSYMNMAFCDFRVKYDPDTEPPEALTQKILYSIFIKPVKAHKPRIAFIGGESGEGKSLSTISLMIMLLKLQGVNPKNYINAINVYTPLEYPEKINKILGLNEGGFKKTGLKKINLICLHEAREIVKAKLWQGFIAQATSDINAMSRQIKRLCTFIISQFIRDITPDVRYTLNYYCIVRRPIGKKARLYINVIWKDDRDLEKPKLRRRKLSGYIVDPKGRHKRFIPQYLEITKPNKEIVAEFEKKDYEAKAGIIKHKINKLIKEMKDDLGEESQKIKNMVDWYINKNEDLSLIGKQHRGRWKVNKAFREMHELNNKEVSEFEKLLNDEYKKKGILESEEQIKEVLGLRTTD